MKTILPPTDKTPPQWIADLDRVIKDVTAEGLDPNGYDCIAIAVELRILAGDRPLDSVADDAWVELLAWHMRAPMPLQLDNSCPTSSSRQEAGVSR